MRFDVVVVGSGPNGLAAAITLASHGLRVRVLESADQPGGGLASEELTRSGFIHDVCSSVHPLGIGSPLFRALPLQNFGLEWVHPSIPVAHPLDEQPTPVLDRSIENTVDRLGPDGSSYQQLYEPLAEDWDRSIVELLSPIRPNISALHVARWAWPGLASAHYAASAFVGKRARALFAGLAAHSMIPLEHAPSAAIALVLGAAGHAVGWPMPRGGAGELAAALVRLLEAMGGDVVCGTSVRSLLDVPPARATILNLTPKPAFDLIGTSLSSGYRRRLAKYQYGPGVFKLDWALSNPIPWHDPVCARAGTVHVGGSFDEIARSERAIFFGKHPDQPFVLVTQPSLFDDRRAPFGQHTAWAYCHVPAGSQRDMSYAIERQIERFAPGFRDCIIERSTLSSTDLESRNPNLVGGDLGAGVLNLRRLLLPMITPRTPYETSLADVFLCSAATPPGAGVHGMCGFHAARSVLRRRFHLTIPRDPAHALGPNLRLGNED
jgi:phytoene dehydrogenase-like protein